MTVPVLITDLSTTALDNAPSGEDAPSVIDNVMRAHAAFIAKLRDESQTIAGKDASGGYAGLTLFKLNLRNAADTFTSWLTNAATAARTWTLPDYDGTLATLAGTETLTNKTMVAPALGTPASGVVTNLTGTASININGTVGATTPNTGVFTTATAAQTSAGAIVYPSVLRNSEDSTNGTGVGQTFGAHASAATGRIVNVRDAAGLYSLRLSTFINGTALTEILKLKGTGGVEVLSGAFGYGVGNGGTVTQATSRTTGVTLNKASGAITLFTAAGSATPATFTVTNSLVTAADVPEVVCKSSTNVYLTKVTAVASGSFNVTFWTTGGTTSDAPVFSFDIFSGAAS